MSEDDRVSTEPNGNGLRSRVVAQIRVPLLRNAYSLVSSTIANAALGLVFWVVAARVFHPTVVGRDSSLIAAMTFVSVLAQLNLNNGFNRFVPTAGHETRRLVLAGYAAAISLSLLAAGVFLLGIHVWTPRLGYLDHHPYEAAWFVVATMIWTVFVLEDSVLIGLGEAHWVLVENSIFGVIKVGALVVIATQIHRYGIFLAWTAPTILLVIPVNWFLFRKAIPRRSDHEPLENLDARVIARFVGPDFAAQMVRTATTSLTPIIVLAIAGSSATAYAAVASMVGYTLYLLIINMGASLVTEASRAPERLAEYTRKLLSHCFGIVVPLALVLAISAHYVLSLFGEEYAERATVSAAADGVVGDPERDRRDLYERGAGAAPHGDRGRDRGGDLGRGARAARRVAQGDRPRRRRPGVAHRADGCRGRDPAHRLPLPVGARRSTPRPRGTARGVGLTCD